MEDFEVRLTESGINIEGFPDAAMVIQLPGSKARQIADFALHRFDLEIALASLEGINATPLEAYLVRESLWRSAIVHCLKCFKESNSRACLDPKEVFERNADALEIYEYFLSLRNKHIVHDENSYAQSLPGAILNKPEAEYKVAKIVCFSAWGETLEQENWSNLNKMVTDSLNYVQEQFNRLADTLTMELESQSYEQLAANKKMTYTKPKLEDISKARLRDS